MKSAGKYYQSRKEQKLKFAVSILPEGLSDSLSQVFHQLYYQTIGQGNSELSQPQYQAYQAIAAQCPFINVEAVYRSRIILLAKGDTLYYNDSLICSVHGITVKSTKPLVYKPKPTQVLSFSIFPNPTDGITNVQVNLVPEKEFTFIISDILGRELYRVNRYMDSNRHVLDLRSFDTGVYLLRVMNGQETIYKSQIQVNK